MNAGDAHAVTLTFDARANGAGSSRRSTSRSPGHAVPSGCLSKPKWNK
ncbi:MAG: hypothetical protein ACLRMJ_07310 [Alistipes finegoldii]